MIEKIILDYLKAALDVPVSMQLPADPPPRCVVLEKTGSSCTDHIYTAMLVVQSYASSLYGAAALNEQVKAAMADADTLSEVCAVRLNTDYNFTDTASKRYRYQAVFDITHY